MTKNQSVAEDEPVAVAAGHGASMNGTTIVRVLLGCLGAVVLAIGSLILVVALWDGLLGPVFDPPQFGVVPHAPLAVRPGEEFELELEVENHGDYEHALQGVSLSPDLVRGFEVLSSTPPGDFSSWWGGVDLRLQRAIPPYLSRTVVLRMRAKETEGRHRGRIDVEASHTWRSFGVPLQIEVSRKPLPRTRAVRPPLLSYDHDARFQQALEAAVERSGVFGERFRCMRFVHEQSVGGVRAYGSYVRSLPGCNSEPGPLRDYFLLYFDGEVWQGKLERAEDWSGEEPGSDGRWRRISGAFPAAEESPGE